MQWLFWRSLGDSAASFGRMGLPFMVAWMALLGGCVTESRSNLPAELAAEYAPRDLTTAAHPCEEVLLQLRPLPYHVRIDPSKPNWIACPSGTRIFIPPHSFEDSYLGEIGSTVDLYISEATNNWETIVFDVAQPIGPGRIPSTLGTLRLKAYADDRSLALKEDKAFLLCFPVMPDDWAYYHHGESLLPFERFYWDYGYMQQASKYTEDLLPASELVAPYPAFLEYGLAEPATMDFADDIHEVPKLLDKVLGQSAHCPRPTDFMQLEHKIGFRVDDKGVVQQVHVTGTNAECLFPVIDATMKMIRWDLSKVGDRREWNFSLWTNSMEVVPATSAVSDEAIVHYQTLNPIYRGKLRQVLGQFTDAKTVEAMVNDALVVEQLGWMTVDTGFPVSEPVRLTVDLGDSLHKADAKVWIMYPDMHAAIETARDSMGNFTFEELPKGLRGEIVALAYDKRLGLHFGVAKWGGSRDQRLRMYLNPITEQQLKRSFGR